MPRPLPPRHLPTQAQRPRESVILSRCVRIEESGCGGRASSTFASASTANLCTSSLAAPVSTAITDSTQLSTLHLLKKPPRGSPEGAVPLWREFEGVPQHLLYKPSWAGWWEPPTCDSQSSIGPLSTVNSDCRDRHLSPYLPHQPAHPEALEGRAHTAFRPSSGAGWWVPPTCDSQSSIGPLSTANSDSRHRHLSPYLPHQPAHPEALEGRAHTAFRPSSGAGRWLPPTSAFQSMPVLTPITTSNSP